MSDRVADLICPKAEKDRHGIRFPTSADPLRTYETAWTETSFRYRIPGQQYILEVSLCRNWHDDHPTKGYTEIRFFSKDWDALMGGIEGGMRDNWELGANLDALFPEDALDHSETSRYRRFIDTVNQIKQFVVEAAGQYPDSQEDVA